MTTAVAPEKPENKEEEKVKASDYSCELLLEKTTLEKAKDPKFPSDAYNVTYIVDGKEHLDVTRSGKQSNVFDFYYDKYGKDSIKRIDWGYGNVNPNSYGYKQPQQKKRKRKG